MMSYRRFGDSLHAVADARRWTARLVGDQPDGVRAGVALVVSELCTNSLVHAAGGFDLGIERTAASLLIEVADAGSGTPVVREPAHVRAHGRGLHIVSQLASDWGMFPVDGPGKIVWARMSLVL